ncbi:MAG TPA: flavodoxin domain-containing protein, partial [Candidatus Saccharimonadia bacterium]|nr:flavodoxin domain-containing protein [Candidatus Saccharimonadia bacterium]
MLPEHSPFSPDQRRILQDLLAGFSPAQRFWLGGYLSAGDAAGAAPVGAAAGPKLTVLYGTESGNSEKLADLSVKEAKKRGYQAVAKNMADISVADLGKVENLLVIVSTWGDGDPPETAVPFNKDLMSTSLTFPKLRYSVCALGDTSYERFCHIGKEVDARLEALGGSRISPRQDCDVDYDDAHRTWLAAALEAFGPVASAAGAVPASGGFSFAPAGPTYDKKNPYSAEMQERVLLNGKGTAKETWHYEIALENSGITYEPSDSLAIVPQNAPDMVEGILKAAKLTGTEAVELNGSGSKSLADALREDFDITALSKQVLTKLQAFSKSKKLSKLLADDGKDQLKDYLWGRWIADAIADFLPKGLSPADLVSALRKLPPRLYSIASSPLAHPGEVHLTVSSVRYNAHGQDRKGVASTYLADLVGQGDRVAVYGNENKNFRLPASGDTPIIMIGPGTGVAPFRAFVEHRAALGHAGKSWLFFGDQRYTFDFLYQVEWQEHLKNGALAKL